MELTISGLAAFAIIGTICGLIGYFITRRKLLAEIEFGKHREEELARKIYEAAVLKEIGDRIGYSLDAAKIIEIITGSLSGLLSYSTASNMIISGQEDKVRFECQINESVNDQFVKEIKVKMLAALSEMMKIPIVDREIDEIISGKILDDSDYCPVESYFNLPIVISGKVIGIINVASKRKELYRLEETDVLYRIVTQASEAVSKLQDLLENEKGKLSQAVESLSDGVLMVNLRYEVILVNKKLRQLLGIVDNPKIFDVVNALSGRFDVRSKMEEAVAKGEPLDVEEILIKDKVLEVYVSRVLNGRNLKPMGVVVLFRDVTDVKSLEKLRQDFTAMMVHELRSPLTSIRSTVELLHSDLSKVSQDELKKYLVTIDSTSESMLELVNDLLDVAKLEAGKFDVVCESGDLAQVVLDRVETYKPIAAEKNLKIICDIEKDLPQVWFDKVRIKQVFNNLLSNAIKFTDTGEITLSVRREKLNGNPVDILVSVKDTGVGIAPDQLNKLFSRFGQLETGRKTGSVSSGLGLFIAKGIVEASGGKIWVESAGLGLGSTFRFTVILADQIPAHNFGTEENEAGRFSSGMNGFTTQKIAKA